MATISFRVLAHDLASRTFRGVGRAAMAMAAKIRAADAMAGNVGGVTRMRRAYIGASDGVNRLNNAFSRLTGGGFSGEARLWTRVILAGLTAMPPVIGAVVAGLGALGGGLVAVAPGAVAFGAALVGIAQRLKAVIDGTRQGSPALNRAADAFRNLKRAWSGFLDGTEGSVARVFTQAFQGLAELLPRLTPMANRFANVFSAFLANVRKEMQSPAFEDALRWFTRVGGIAFDNLLNSGENLIKFLYNLSRALENAGVDITFQWLEDLTRKWNNWAKAMRNDKGFQEFFAYIREQWPKVREILTNLWQTFQNLWKGMEPVAADILDFLEGLTEKMSKITPAQWEAIARGLIAFGIAVKTLGAALKVATIGASIGRMAGGLARLAATPWGAIAIGIGLVVAGLWKLYNSNETFKGAVDSGVIYFIKTVLRNLNTLKQRIIDVLYVVVSSMEGIRSAFVGGLQRIAAAVQAARFVNALLSRFRTLRTQAIAVVQNMMTRMPSLIRTGLMNAAAAANNFRGTFVSALRTAFQTTRQVATTTMAAIAQTVRSRLQNAQQTARSVGSAIRAALGTAFRNASNVVRSTTQAMATAVRSRLQAMRSTAQTVGGAIRASLTTAFRNAAAGVRTATTNMSSVFRAAMGSMRAAAANAGGAIRARLSSAARAARAAVSSAARGMASALGSAAGRIAGIAGRIAGTFSRIGGAASRAAGLVRGLAGAINSLRSKTVTITANVVGSALGKLGGLLAKGGPARAHVPYIVGEKGPELFVPDRNGTVVPNDKIGGMGGDSALMRELVGAVHALRADLAEVKGEVADLPRKQRDYGRGRGR